MITCYNCGKEVSDETLICPECGALVRRYERPPVRQQPDVPPMNPMNPIYTQPSGQVKNKRGFRTGVKVWMWLCIAFFGLYTISFLFTGIQLMQNGEVAQLIVDMFRQSGLDLEAIYGSLSVLGWTMVISGAGCLIECAMLIALLATRRRLFVKVLMIGSLVLVVVMVILTGLSMFTLLYLVCAAVTFLLLKRDLPAMRP